MTLLLCIPKCMRVCGQAISSGQVGRSTGKLEGVGAVTCCIVDLSGRADMDGMRYASRLQAVVVLAEGSRRGEFVDFYWVHM